MSVLAAALAFGINARRVKEVSQALGAPRVCAHWPSRKASAVLDEQKLSRRYMYASRMRQAQQAWRDGNLTLLRGILQSYVDGTPDATLRHFEWYHLNYLANVPHQVMRGHRGEVYCVAYAPDGADTDRG